MTERCFVMLKPGAINRRIVGEIIGRLERKWLNLIAIKLIKVSPELAQQHYAEHKKKDFFPRINRLCYFRTRFGNDLGGG